MTRPTPAHTPEPWRANYRRPGFIDVVAHAEGAPPVTVIAWGGFDDSDRTVAQLYANARRIVECVNALEGFSDPSAAKDLLADNTRLREALGKLEGNDEHPENRCERCGGRNICWFAASEIWNAHSDGANILCPICFVAAAESAGRNHSAWQLIPERARVFSDPSAAKGLLEAAKATAEFLRLRFTSVLDAGDAEDPDCWSDAGAYDAWYVLRSAKAKAEGTAIFDAALKSDTPTPKGETKT